MSHVQDRPLHDIWMDRSFSQCILARNTVLWSQSSGESRPGQADRQCWHSLTGVILLDSPAEITERDKHYMTYRAVYCIAVCSGWFKHFQFHTMLYVDCSNSNEVWQSETHHFPQNCITVSSDNMIRFQVAEEEPYKVILFLTYWKRSYYSLHSLRGHTIPCIL